MARNADRVNNRDVLVPILAAELRQRPTQYWLKAFKDVGVPAGPINSINKVLTDDYAAERRLVKPLHHALDSALPTVANPVGFSRTPVEYGAAPPMLGEHTESILRDWLGYSTDQIETLLSSGAV
jgi:crotonobetainyl-CoA:carnitine CoA-transferase CaiB-like acyl-CoA transferase